MCCETENGCSSKDSSFSDVFMFSLAVQAKQFAELPQALQDLLTQEMTPIYGSMQVDPVSMNNQFLQKNSTSARHIVSGMLVASLKYFLERWIFSLLMMSKQ